MTHVLEVEVDCAQCLDMQRQLVKVCLDSSYGKGAAGDYPIFQAELQEKAFQIGGPFLGAYLLGTMLLFHRATVIKFAAQS